MKKATHKGHCQICGSCQMLPGGMLAKHGYTTRWGFFSGVCSGAGWRPFEVATDRIEAAIEIAEGQAASLREQANLRESTIDPADVMHDVYRGTPRQRFGRYEKSREAGRVEEVPGMRGFLQFVAHADGFQPASLGPGRIADKVAELNRAEAWRLRQAAKQREDYVAWQRDRVANWKPGELLPRQ